MKRKLLKFVYMAALLLLGSCRHLVLEEIPSHTPDPIVDIFPLNCEVSFEVEDGDTLKAIASNYRVSEEAIKRHNNLKTDEVYSGMKLAIPLCKDLPTLTVVPEN